MGTQHDSPRILAGASDSSSSLTQEQLLQRRLDHLGELSQLYKVHSFSCMVTLTTSLTAFSASADKVHNMAACSIMSDALDTQLPRAALQVEYWAVCEELRTRQHQFSQQAQPSEGDTATGDPAKLLLVST